MFDGPCLAQCRRRKRILHARPCTFVSVRPTSTKASPLCTPASWRLAWGYLTTASKASICIRDSLPALGSSALLPCLRVPYQGAAVSRLLTFRLVRNPHHRTVVFSLPHSPVVEMIDNEPSLLPVVGGSGSRWIVVTNADHIDPRCTLAHAALFRHFDASLPSHDDVLAERAELGAAAAVDPDVLSWHHLEVGLVDVDDFDVVAVSASF